MLVHRGYPSDRGRLLCNGYRININHERRSGGWLVKPQMQTYYLSGLVEG